MANNDIPQGFHLIRPFGKFHELIGPLYGKLDGEHVVVGMRVEDKHGNRGNNLHGGMVCALADSAMTYACALRRPPEHGAVTTGLTVEMMGAAQPGDWIEAHVEVMRQGRSVIFLNLFILRGEQKLARASATFQVVPRPGMAREPLPGAEA